LTYGKDYLFVVNPPDSMILETTNYHLKRYRTSRLIEKDEFEKLFTEII